MNKVTVLLIAAIIAMSFFAFSQTNEIPNAGFENWNGTAIVGWTHNSNVPPLDVVTQTTDAYSGNFAVRGEVKDFAGTSFPPTLFSGSAQDPRFPVTTNPIELNGFYKYQGQGGDAVLITVALQNDNVSGGAEGHFEFAVTQNSYTAFSIPIIYDDNNPPGWQAIFANITVVIKPLDGQLPHAGTTFFLDHLNFDGAPVGIEEVNNGQAPTAFQLKQNYPNPFNPSTTIEFAIPTAERVQLVVYNQLGQEVARLADEPLAAGNYQFVWDAGALPSGVYFYRLTAGAFSESKKFILMK